MLLQDNFSDKFLHYGMMFPSTAVGLIHHLVVTTPAPKVGVLLHAPPLLPHLPPLAVLQLRPGVPHSSGPEEVCPLGWKDLSPSQEVRAWVLSPVLAGRVLRAVEMGVLRTRGSDYHEDHSLSSLVTN